ncbi:MAG: polysaccharide biosynthesis tyrosine autokinase [Anaerolineales bacterium]
MDTTKPEERTTAEAFVMYAELLWHWAWLLVLCAVLAGGVTFWLSYEQIPVYQATTTILVDVAPASQAVNTTTVTTSEELADTYSNTILMQPVLDGVAKRLNLPAFPKSATVQATPVLNTQLITLVVQDIDPNRAAQIANTLVQVFSDKLQADQAARYTDSSKGIETQLANLQKQIQATQAALAALGPASSDPSRQAQQAQLQLALTQYNQSYASVLQSEGQLQLAEAQSSSGIIQQDTALPVDTPISPQPVRDAVLAAVTGLLIAIGGVFLIEFLDDTIRDPDEITRRWGVPVLGTIIRYPHDRDTLITARQPRSPITEAFRSLRTNLQFAGFDQPIHTILVTSPSPEDGKTTVTANLASVIAQGGRRVAVVDADMRRPRIHKTFQIPNRDGLSSQFIRYQDRLNGSVKPTQVDGLFVLTSGPLPPNPSELLGSDRMSAILRELAGQFDTVIVDAPPVLLVTDALVLAPCVDGVLVVVKPSITKRAALKHMIEELRQVNANILGVVLNDVKIDRSHYYNYHYRGYYNQRKNYGKAYGYLETSPEPSSEPATTTAETVVIRPSLLGGVRDAQGKKTTGHLEGNGIAVPDKNRPDLKS